MGGGLHQSDFFEGYEASSLTIVSCTLYLGDGQRDSGCVRSGIKVYLAEWERNNSLSYSLSLAR